MELETYKKAKVLQEDIEEIQGIIDDLANTGDKVITEITFNQPEQAINLSINLNKDADLISTIRQYFYGKKSALELQFNALK